ncbi:polyprenyl synthetase family protein [Deferribacter thermophilus]|uniref:polyprenyl synthetase family protein n=1 Tax=Deferribacter thermophilus TaxID=53573 RepID=UPI003C228AEC
MAINQINQVFDLLKDEIKNVEEELLRNLDSEVQMVNEVASYVFKSGGKRLRPVFLILSSKLSGYDGPRSIVISGVVEYIHTATLLHDDVIDGAMYRRGKKAANRVFGNDITVLCGDFLYSRAFVNLVKDGDPDVQMILANAAKTMSEGEVFQLVKTANFDLSMDDYLKIIFSKTAVLFSSCCEIGAVLAKKDMDTRNRLKEYGKLIGLAFQMSDDILDYLGDENKTGKKPGTDLKEGKMTLPLILLRDILDANNKEKIKEIILKDEPNEDDLNYIIELMKKYNIKEKAEQFVDSFIEKAKEQLSIFDNSIYKDALIYLSEYVIKRDR